MGEIDRESARACLVEYWESVRDEEDLGPHDPVLDVNLDGTCVWSSALIPDDVLLRVDLDGIAAWVGPGLPEDIEQTATDVADAFVEMLHDCIREQGREQD